MFGYPPPRWAKSALKRKDLRIAVTVVSVLVFPVLLGSISTLSDADAPLEQSVLNSVWGNNATAGQSLQLSELRTGAAAEQDFDLTAQVTTRSAFVWPAAGDITSYMDSDHPMGIDIGLEYDEDSPVTAAARGVVEFAGGSEWDTYGYYVKIDHGGGLETLYAHLDAIFVQPGQTVAQGEEIGYGGDTGKSSGKHLHFEVRQGDYLANPLDLLPQLPEEPKLVQLDCNFGILVIDRGSSADLDFSASMPAGSKIATTSVRYTGVPSEIPLPEAEKVSDGLVHVDTLPFVEPSGMGTQASFGLDLVIDTGREHYKTCEINVQTRMSDLVAYSDASILSVSSGYEAPPEESQPAYVEPTAPPAGTEALPPTEEPLVVPTGVSMLGELASPTPSPTPTETATPTATATPRATESPTPLPTSTATPEPAEPASDATPSDDE